MMTVKHGVLFAEVWERANGTWSYEVMPGGSRDEIVAEALVDFSWRPYSDVEYWLFFKRCEDGIRGKRKRWWRKDSDCGTGEQRALGRARESLKSLSHRVEHLRDERDRRLSARRVEE